MNRFGVFLFAVLALGVSAVAYFRPLFYPDVVPYAAVVLAQDEPDFSRVHQQVYADLVKEIGPQEDQQLRSVPGWWSGMRDHPEWLRQEFPFYANRPLYIQLARALVRWGGMGAFDALHLVSALSLLGIAALLLAWLRNPLYAALLLLTPAVLQLGRIATPDALSTALMFAGIFFIVQRKLSLGCALLLISIFARTDNLIPSVIIFLWLWGRKELTRVSAGAMSAAALASVAAINSVSHFYGWAAVFINTEQAVSAPGQAAFHMTPGYYFHVLYLGLRSAWPDSEIAIWALLALLALRLLRDERLGGLLKVAGIALAARFLMFPFPQDRYFAWAYLLAGVGIVSAARSQFTERESAKAAAASAT